MCNFQKSIRSEPEKQLCLNWRDIFAPLPVSVMKDAEGHQPFKLHLKLSEQAVLR